jgi:toxin HigB-1
MVDLIPWCPNAWFNNSSRRFGVIVSVRDEWLRDFFIDDLWSKMVPPDLENWLFRKLQLIDDATSDLDLRAPPSNHFEKLRGNLAAFHSIRVNRRWRLVFEWNGAGGEARDVYLDDHSYR